MMELTHTQVNLNPIDVIKEAWQRTYGVKGTIWANALAAAIIVGLCFIVLGLSFGAILGFHESLVDNPYFSIIISVMASPLYAALACLSINIINGESVEGDQLFGKYKPYRLRCIMANFLKCALIFVFGFTVAFLILSVTDNNMAHIVTSLIALTGSVGVPIFLMLMYPLICLKNMKVLQAMKTSAKLVWQHLGSTILLFLSFIAFNILVALPIVLWNLLGFFFEMHFIGHIPDIVYVITAMIYFVPLYHLIYGIYYREISKTFPQSESV